MTLAFDSKELRMVCENQDLANDKYGAPIASRLHDRLADIMAGENIFDVIVGNPSICDIKDDTGYKIDLAEDYVLLLISGHVKTPTKQNGQIDWDKVTRVKIISIEKH